MSAVASDLRIPAALDRRSVAIDALRAGAALAVVGLHYFEPGGPFDSQPLFWLFHNGWAAVNLFFVLSGYLVSQPLLDGRPSIVAFYARRLARTGPLFAVLCAIAGAAFLAFGHIGSLMRIWWSLAVEEQFYLVLPIAALALSRRGLVRALAIAIAIAPVIRLASIGLVDPAIAKFALPYNMDSLAAGVLIAIALRDPDLLGRARRSHGWILAALGVLIAALLVAPEAGDLARAVKYELFNLTAAALVLWAAITPLRTHRLLSWIGARSYPIYLFHRSAVLLISPLVGNLFGAPIALAVLLALSALLHSTIEQPIHDWARRRFAYGRRILMQA